MAKRNAKKFMGIVRQSGGYRPVCERTQDHNEVAVIRKDSDSVAQALRCMDCGTPFCHWGCPVSNIIPEWNECLSLGNWKKAYELLIATNNFPEFTGRLCPALCESACVLGINDDSITIRENELGIIEYAFKKGWVKPLHPNSRTGRKVAVIGSGTAGLAAAQELNRQGHTVTVYEKADKVGGFLRYGIPDFKLEKWIIDRRVDIMKEEGIVFKTNIDVGVDYDVKDLLRDYDAVLLAGGSREIRDLNIPGREAAGIYFAVDYLAQANRVAAGEYIPDENLITASGKTVVVIGGGDTGADCVGTANRQKASCITQIEVMPQPSECRSDDYPWPNHPLLLKTTSSHEEGAEREWSILTKEFVSESGKVKKLACSKVEFIKEKNGSCPRMKEVVGSEFEINADIVILAVGFLYPEHGTLLADLNVEFDTRGNVKTDERYQTNVNKVFSAGDMRRGQSLIVWAIDEGRKAAYNVDRYLSEQGAAK